MIAGRRAFQAFALVALATATELSEFCKSIKSCLKDGSSTCDTTLGQCPPCIYALDSTYTCWEMDNVTKSCPFTGVRYDCSASWRSATSSSIGSATPAISSSSPELKNSTASSSILPRHSVDTISSNIVGGLSSDLITYGAIGLGVVLVLVTLGVLCIRRRTMQRRREENDTVTGTFGGNQDASDKRIHGVSKRDDGFSGPYNNILDTSKGNYAASSGNSGYGRHSKELRREPIKSSSHVPTGRSQHSFDGILDASRSPAVLGGSVRGSLKSGGRSIKGSKGSVGGFSNVNEYVQQDVSSRCSTTPNVFGEYLRMKQEMQYDDAGHCNIGGMTGMSFSDTVSDLDSGKYSFESLQGTSRPPQRQMNVDGRLSAADSITDSEYGEQLRARGESDCDSEMSYNDEKYSFSSIDSLDDSQVRKLEVEI